MLLGARDEWIVKFFSPSAIVIRGNWIRSSPDSQISEIHNRHPPISNHGFILLHE